MMQRREFIAGLGSAAAWPIIVRAQPVGRVRRIGVLMGWSESDPEYQSRLGVFVQELTRLGWVNGATIEIMQRWSDGDIDRARVMAKELVAWRPDVIFAGTTPAAAALHQETRAVPVVFVSVADPIGAGFARSLNRPDGNITGFINDEATLAGKQMGLLKEMAPRIKRAAIVFNPDTTAGGGAYYLASFEAAARTLGLQPTPVHVRSDAEIEAAISTLDREIDSLVLMNDSYLIVHLATIISALRRNEVPGVSNAPQFAERGGLIAYSPIYSEMYRRAAGYVDRILRGAKPADLPIELPTRFNLVINVATAQALGLSVPATLLVSADKLIE